MWERALYAWVARDVGGVLPACGSWQDALWARLRCGASLDTAVAQLDGDESARVRAEARAPLARLQRLLMVGDMDGALELVAHWAAQPRPRPDLLRTAVHVALLLCRVPAGSEEEAEEVAEATLSPDEPAVVAIVRAFIGYLAATGHGALVAQYAALLPHAEQVEAYAAFLAPLETDRELYLRLAARAGLDVGAIAKAVVEGARGETAPFDSLVKRRRTTPATSPDTQQRELLGAEWDAARGDRG